MADKLEEVERISDNLGLETSLFQQIDIIQLVTNPFNSVWTTVYQIRHDLYSMPAIFSCLADTKHESKILDGTDWLRHAGGFNPGFCETSAGTHYVTGRSDGYDFLVKEVYFHALETAQLHINQEFVFLFELFRGEDGCYYAIDECGCKEKVVDIADNVVRFKTSYIMRYIAAKQMLYVQFIDSRRSSESSYPMGTELMCEEDCRGDSYHYGIWYQSTKGRDYLFSMLFARSIVRPKNVNECKIWPYDRETEEQFPEFIVAELPDGSYKRFSCDPSKLANYFGANPDAPHYLTPVYFKPDVLDRYRNNPHFKVTERRLSCGTQWSVEIDNIISSRVMVYLGDLGRDLPQSERRHFLDHEISPTEQHMSETAFAEDFLCSFYAPLGPISALFAARDKLNNTWTTKFGHPLFRPLHSDENDMEKLIRIPSGNGRQEFDTVILNLNKYCVDYLDETALASAEQSGGINKLEATLSKLKINADLTPLRDLQNVRSACMAHAKGKKYEQLKSRLLTGDCPKDVSRLIERLTSMMSQLASNIEPLATDNETKEGIANDESGVAS